MAYTAGGYDSDVEGGGPYQDNIGGAFTDKAVRLKKYFFFACQILVTFPYTVSHFHKII
jgi:hypothetical protein